MNDACAIRKNEDVAKLRALEEEIASILEAVRVLGSPPQIVSFRIKIPTARNAKFPTEQQGVSEVEIQLPERYPFQAPNVVIKTPIWNPNVYASGKWCFGEWKVAENMRLFVIRLMKVIALDPTIVNPQSPANGDAARWYVQILSRTPELFPTVSVQSLMPGIEGPKISWRTIR